MASQTLGAHSETHSLSLVPKRVYPLSGTASEDLMIDDGLGCIRGLAFAMAFNVVLVLTSFAGWTLWHHLIR
jgi:hypothetical protein